MNRKLRAAPQLFMHKGLMGWLVTALLLTAFSDSSQADPWPTTEFEVFLGPPIARQWGDSEVATYLDGIPTLSDVPSFKLAKKVEAALSRAAKKYEAMGFPAPRLEPLITRDDGSRAYRVYVCKQSWLDKLEDDVMGSDNPFEVAIPGLPTLRSIWESCGELAAHNGTCSETQGFRNYLYFNSDRIFKGPTLSGFDYATIVHELFHAIHANTASGAGNSPCLTGGWIMEGLADAISIDLTRELWPGVSLSEMGQAKEFGVRRYSTPLPHRDFKYATSSFWRHVGEWYYAMTSNGGRRSGSMPANLSQPDAGPASDYRFLVDLLEKPLQGTAGLQRELQWLDDGLRTTRGLKTNLARMYSEFTASFADELRTRIKPGYGGTPLEQPPANTDEFLAHVFQPCSEIRLSPTSPAAVETLTVASVAAVCFEVTVEKAHGKSAPKQVAVTISTGPYVLDKIKPLWIGKSGGMEVAPFNVFGSRERTEAPGYGTVQFAVEVGKPTVFTLSNVAYEAEKSKLLTPQLTFMIDGWDSSLTTPPPPQKAPVRKSAETRPDDAKGQQEKAIEETFAEELGRLTSNGMGSTDIKRNFGEFGGCSGEKKKYNLCGPQLKIELELISSAASTAATSTTGGFFNQMRAGGVGQISDMSMAELAALSEAQDSLSPKLIEGGKITIDIPKIDYGYQGTFQHARITVSRDGEGVYAATSPSPVVMRSPSGGEIKRRVPNGKVTIDEYTPFILRGTFEGNLVERNNRTAENPYATLPVVERIAGHFAIANPFTSDREYTADKEAFLQQTGLDVLDNPVMSGATDVEPSDFLSPADIAEFCAAGFDDEMLESMGYPGGCSSTNNPSGSAKVSEDPECVCDCDEYLSPIKARCEPTCTEDYARCAVSLDDPELERFKSLLKASPFPEMMHQQYLDDFTKMDAAGRQSMVQMIEMTIEAVGND